MPIYFYLSPSPSRSFHRRRRRKTKDSSTIDESEHDESMSNLKTGENFFSLSEKQKTQVSLILDI